MAEPKGPGTDIGGGSRRGVENPTVVGSSARVSLSVGRAVIGWGVLFVVLIGMADIPATAELAAAFAWLIFVSVMMLYGPTALGTLGGLLGGTDS